MIDSKAGLLIVDDDLPVLDVLKSLFEDEYRLFTAVNGEVGLTILRENDIQVIVTDERMPGMTGLEFLKRAREIKPLTMNAMLTAYSDVTVAIEGINSGLLNRYLLKPWNSEDLKVVVHQLFEQGKLIVQNQSLSEELKIRNQDLQARIAELHQTQEKLVQHEKLAAMGQLSASIGHELKNPLARIKSAAALLQNEFKNIGNEGQELLRIIDNEITVATKIINDLLDYSRERKPTFEHTQIDPIIDDTLGRIKFPSDIALERSIGFELKPVRIDPGQIQQILVNLIMNALQAMSDSGGKLYITTAAKEDGVILTVKDTGVGMSPEQLERVFEPLYTTKPKGIGLGMTIVKTLLDKHGATIALRSRENIGTTVTLTFPT